MGNEIIVAIMGATAAISSAIVAGLFKLAEFRKKRNIEDEEDKPLTQTKLFDHELFSKAQYFIDKSLKDIRFDDPDKSWIFETILKNKINSISNNVTKFLEKNDLEELSDEKFENAIFLTFSNIMQDWRKNAKEDFKAYFGCKKGERIFNLVMDKESSPESPSMGFMSWQCPVIDYLEKSIKNHCEAPYPNNVIKMNAILNEFTTSLNSIFPYVAKTFSNFNGQLTYLLCL